MTRDEHIMMINELISILETSSERQYGLIVFSGQIAASRVLLDSNPSDLALGISIGELSTLVMGIGAMNADQLAALYEKYRIPYSAGDYADA